jgi:hypothetical protein
MADENPTPEQQLTGALGFLWREILDAKTIGETLRLLLIDRGVFSDAEYLTKYAHAADVLQEGFEPEK